MDAAAAAAAIHSGQSVDVQTHQRHMTNALQHAFLIQHRKDVEAKILSSIEQLAELPQDTLPTSGEKQAFVSSISIFQPSDLDDLVLERNAQSRCGYVLCGKRPRLANNRAWQVNEESQKFCSKECHAKALFVKSQLDSIPAWERTATDKARITLPEDDNGDIIRSPTRRRDPRTDLALERGEKSSSLKPDKVMSAVIVERDVIAPSVPQRPQFDGQSASIEGYVPNQAQREATTMLSDLATLQMPPMSGMAVEHVKDSKDGYEAKAWRDMFDHLPATR